MLCISAKFSKIQIYEYVDELIKIDAECIKLLPQLCLRYESYCIYVSQKSSSTDNININIPVKYCKGYVLLSLFKNSYNEYPCINKIFKLIIKCQVNFKNKHKNIFA